MIDLLVDKVKIHSIWWKKATNAYFVLGVHKVIVPACLFGHQLIQFFVLCLKDLVVNFSCLLWHILC